MHTTEKEGRVNNLANGTCPFSYHMHATDHNKHLVALNLQSGPKWVPNLAYKAFQTCPQMVRKCTARGQWSETEIHCLMIGLHVISCGTSSSIWGQHTPVGCMRTLESLGYSVSPSEVFKICPNWCNKRCFSLRVLLWPGTSLLFWIYSPCSIIIMITRPFFLSLWTLLSLNFFSYSSKAQTVLPALI